jgi:hypothetical protein
VVVYSSVGEVPMDGFTGRKRWRASAADPAVGNIAMLREVIADLEESARSRNVCARATCPLANFPHWTVAGRRISLLVSE